MPTKSPRQTTKRPTAKKRALGAKREQLWISRARTLRKYGLGPTVPVTKKNLPRVLARVQASYKKNQKMLASDQWTFRKAKGSKKKRLTENLFGRATKKGVFLPVPKSAKLTIRKNTAIVRENKLTERRDLRLTPQQHRAAIRKLIDIPDTRLARNQYFAWRFKNRAGKVISYHKTTESLREAIARYATPVPRREETAEQYAKRVKRVRAKEERRLLDAIDLYVVELPESQIQTKNASIVGKKGVWKNYDEIADQMISTLRAARAKKAKPGAKKK